MSVIHTNKTGTGFNSGQTGAMADATNAPPPSPVLLPDLIAGWALTAGPQQTLDSTGVIASGPYDMTANGSVAYGASGGQFNAYGYVAVPTSAGISSGAQPWRISAWLSISADDIENCLCKFDAGFQNSDYELSASLAAGTLTAFAAKRVAGNLCDATQSLAGYSGGVVLIRGAFDPSTDTTYVQINNGTIASHTEALAWATITDGEASIAGFANASTTVGFVRLWIGANAVTLWNDADFRTWEYNNGTPRTDAEIAAYTG